MWPIDVIVREWPLIRDAPLDTFLLGLSGLLIGWGLAFLYFKGRLETASAQVQLRDDKLGDLKDKLAGEPAAQAAVIAAIAELTKQQRLAAKQAHQTDLAIRQGGVDVGSVASPSAEGAQIVFGHLYGSPGFLRAEPFEFQGQNVKLVSWSMVSTVGTPPNQRHTYMNAICNIIREA
jgi:hypothetical protein